MARLPTRENLGPLPSGRTGRTIATFRPPDTSAAARGLIDVGRGLKAASGAMISIADRRRQDAQRDAAFTVQSEFLKFEHGQLTRFTDAAENVQPGARGFAGGFNFEYDEAARSFLSSVPDSLQPQFTQKLVALGGRLDTAASQFEREEQKRFAGVQLDEGQNALLDRLNADPNSWPTVDVDAETQIRAAPLSPIEEDKALRDWRRRRALAYARLDDAESPERFRARILPGAIDVNDPAALLRRFEGFRDTPYWDVNAYRAGFGSDTTTLEDGTVVSIEPGMQVSRADAERDLERRIVEFANTASRQVGGKTWSDLDDATRSALISVTYNYGSLPNRVVSAVKSGNKESIAIAVETLNANPARRRAEAAMIRGGARDVPAPQYADLTFEDRQKLFDASVRAERIALEEEQRTADAQFTANYAAHKDTYALGIAEGRVTEESTILDDPILDDGDKATLTRSLRSQLETKAQVEADRTSFADGRLVLNPFDSDDQKRVNDLYADLIERVPEEQHGLVADEIIGRTGIVPRKVAARIRYGLTSDDPEQLSIALTDAANIAARKPVAIDHMDGGASVRDAVATFRHLMDERFMSAQEGAAHMIEMRSTEGQRNAAVLKDAASKFVRELELSDITDAFDPGWLAAGPEAGFNDALVEEMLFDYREIAREKLIGEARGDPDVARAQAIAELQTLYGVTYVTGEPTLMKYPPEKHYPEETHEYLHGLAVSDAKMVAEGQKVEKVYIQSTPQTVDDIRAGRPARYRLYYATETDGQLIWNEVLGGGFALKKEEVDVILAKAKVRQDMAEADRQRSVRERRERTRRFFQRIEDQLIVGQPPAWFREDQFRKQPLRHPPPTEVP